MNPRTRGPYQAQLYASIVHICIDQAYNAGKFPLFFHLGGLCLGIYGPRGRCALLLDPRAAPFFELREGGKWAVVQVVEEVRVVFAASEEERGVLGSIPRFQT